MRDPVVSTLGLAPALALGLGMGMTLETAVILGLEVVLAAWLHQLRLGVGFGLAGVVVVALPRLRLQTHDMWKRLRRQVTLWHCHILLLAHC